jgi:hypothetical protein
MHLFAHFASYWTKVIHPYKLYGECNLLLQKISEGRYTSLSNQNPNHREVQSACVQLSNPHPRKVFFGYSFIVDARRNLLYTKA